MKHEIFNQYVAKIAKLYRVEEKEMFVRSRKQEMVDARHMLFYLCLSRPIPAYSIKNYMAERGLSIQQSAINNGVRKIEKNISEDSDYARIISDIERSVKL
jgi:chromosomal replication initiation ATPase DnaA